MKRVSWGVAQNLPTETWSEDMLSVLIINTTGKVESREGSREKARNAQTSCSCNIELTISFFSNLYYLKTGRSKARSSLDYPRTGILENRNIREQQI
jgi:hypothetical protein